MVNHWLDFVGKEDSNEYRSKLDEGHANVCPFKKNLVFSFRSAWMTPKLSGKLSI